MEKQLNIKKPEDCNEVHKIFNFICQYCGYDGRTFNGWRQLQVDHIRPKSQGGPHIIDNLITCCSQCNSITSRMKFGSNLGKEEIIEQKTKKVKESLSSAFNIWKTLVLPYIKY